MKKILIILIINLNNLSYSQIVKYNKSNLGSPIEYYFPTVVDSVYKQHVKLCTDLDEIYYFELTQINGDTFEITLNKCVFSLNSVLSNHILSSNRFCIINNIIIPIILEIDRKFSFTGNSYATHTILSLKFQGEYPLKGKICH